jgi:hypothetical protein
MDFKKRIRVMITSISRELNSILILNFRTNKNVVNLETLQEEFWRVNKASC